MFCCAFVTFSYGVLGQAWYLTVSIPDILILSKIERLTHVVITFK